MAQASGFTEDDKVAEYEFDSDVPEEPIFLAIFYEDEYYMSKRGRPNLRSLEYHCFRKAFELIDDIQGWKDDSDSTAVKFVEIAKKAVKGRVKDWELMPHLRIEVYLDAVRDVLTRVRGYARVWSRIDRVYAVLDWARLVLEQRVERYKQFGVRADERHHHVIKIWHQELVKTYEETFKIHCLALKRRNQVCSQGITTSHMMGMTETATSGSRLNSDTPKLVSSQEENNMQLQDLFVTLRALCNTGIERRTVLKLMNLAVTTVEYLIWWSHQGIHHSQNRVELEHAELWRRLILESLPLPLQIEASVLKPQPPHTPRKAKPRSKTTLMILHVEIDGIRMEALYDSGSPVSLLSLNKYYQLQRNGDDMKKPVQKLRNAFGVRWKTFGTTVRKMKLEDSTDLGDPIEIAFHLSDLNDSFGCTLGADFQECLYSRFPYLIIGLS